VSLGLAEAGADVVIASRNLENCEEWAAELNARTGRRTWARRLHVGHWEEIAPFAGEVWETAGAVHILVNNAGMSPLYEDLRDVTEEYWQKVVGVNLIGPFKMMVELGCRMFEAGGGSIINVSSTSQYGPSPNTIPYGAAKAGLATMAKGFVQIWGGRVRVNTVVPGSFRTDVTRFWPVLPPDIAEPEDMMSTVVYLAGEGARYVTGAEIKVAGPH
jgi:NAD(P)-dependent dehydrogenase (short-subunit alcohol dehydrogenase family)